MKYFATILSILSAITFAAGCAPTETSRTTGQVVDDTALVARIKTELGQSMSLSDAAAINVDVYRGTVSLAGFVDNPEKKLAAGAAARRVPGVKDVRNHLEVKPKS